MARENRAENRKKAKEGGAGTDIDDRSSGDISEFLETDFGGDGDEDEDQNPDIKGEEEEETEEADAGKTASESESEGKAEATPSGVKKEGEEEGKSEEEVEAGKAEAGTKEGEKKPEEKKAEEKPAEAAPADKKPEPAPAEKKAEEKKDEVKQPEALTEEEAAKLYGEWRSTTESLIAEHHYKLTEKDVAEFNENPAVFIPKAMSRVYMDSISAAFQQFTQYLPRMVDQVMTARQVREAKENTFFSKWPDLKPHRDAVLRMGAAYRAANPQATLDDFINEVGAQAMVALRINPQGQQQQQSQPQVKEPTFRPATSSGTPTPPKPKSSNPFEQLTQDFSFEDLPDQ
jgi:hypothetical protein